MSPNCEHIYQHVPGEDKHHCVWCGRLAPCPSFAQPPAWQPRRITVLPGQLPLPAAE